MRQAETETQVGTKAEVPTVSSRRASQEGPVEGEWGAEYLPKIKERKGLSRSKIPQATGQARTARRRTVSEGGENIGGENAKEDAEGSQSESDLDQSTYGSLSTINSIEDVQGGADSGGNQILSSPPTPIGGDGEGASGGLPQQGADGPLTQ